MNNRNPFLPGNIWGNEQQPPPSTTATATTVTSSSSNVPVRSAKFGEKINIKIKKLKIFLIFFHFSVGTTTSPACRPRTSGPAIQHGCFTSTTTGSTDQSNAVRLATTYRPWTVGTKSVECPWCGQHSASVGIYTTEHKCSRVAWPHSLSAWTLRLAKLQSG